MSFRRQNSLKGSKLETVRFEEYVYCPLRDMIYLIRVGQRTEQSQGSITFEVLIDPHNYGNLVVYTEFPVGGGEAIIHDIFEANISIDFSKIEVLENLSSKRLSFWTSVVSKDKFRHPQHPPFYRIMGSKAAMAAKQAIEEKEEEMANDE